MWSQCWAIWGPCPVLGHLDFAEPMLNPNASISCVWVGKNHTGTYHVPMLGKFGAMLGQCWANRCLCWAYVEPFAAYVGPMVGHLVGFMGFHCNFWNQKISQTKTFRLGYFLGPEKIPTKKRSLGFSWGSNSRIHWAILGRFGSMLGPCWVIWWAFWGSMQVSGGEKQPPTQSFLCWGLFWATFLGPCWVIWWALWGSMGSLEGKNNPQHKSFCVEGYFGRLFGTMLGQCWAVLGPCWANVGSFGGLSGVPWGGKPSTENF